MLIERLSFSFLKKLICQVKMFVWLWLSTSLCKMMYLLKLKYMMYVLDLQFSDRKLIYFFQGCIMRKCICLIYFPHKVQIFGNELRESNFTCKNIIKHIFPTDKKIDVYFRLIMFHIIFIAIIYSLNIHKDFYFDN